MQSLNIFFFLSSVWKLENFTFSFDLSDELKIKIKKLAKKDKKKAEIINNDSETINRYKNLRHDLSEYKRVHIDQSFVLIFKVDIKNNFILFADFDHHDKVYP